MYDGGTTLEDAANAMHANATISMQEFCTEKTLDLIEAKGQEVIAFNHPIGVEGTDRFLMEVSRLTGKAHSRFDREGTWTAGRRNCGLERPHSWQEVCALRRS